MPARGRAARDKGSAITTYLLLQTSAGTASAVVDEARAWSSVEAADLVRGAFDVVIALHDEDAVDPVVERVSSMGGVLRVLPCRVNRADEMVATGAG